MMGRKLRAACDRITHYLAGRQPQLEPAKA